jgi:hypothetical protein
MIVIGVDAHKRTHTLVAVDGVTGAGRGSERSPPVTLASWMRCGSRQA